MKKSYELLVLIPVLKEADNIAPLISRFKQLKINPGILFIVTTPSGTKKEDPTLKAVKKHASENKDIHCILSKKKQGLGRSYKKGIKYAQNNFNFNYLATMDGDGSHPPKYLPKMLRHKNHADLIISSRYIQGGGSSDWSKIREKGSKLVNFACRKLLNISVRDVTSGFRVYSKQIIERVNLDTLKSRGFVFQVEFFLKCLRKEATYLEIPFEFKSREKGGSKFRTIDKLEYIKVLFVPTLRGLAQKIRLNFAKIYWLLKLGLKMSWMKMLQLTGRDYFFPYRLMVKINNYCNYQCKTCRIWQNSKKEYLPPQKQEEIFKKFGQYIFFLTITGGEPFINESKLYNFVNRALQKSPNLQYISINTNCSKPDAIYHFLNYLLQNNPNLQIYVGVHYIPNQEWGETKTGIKNAFSNYKKTERKIRRLQSIYGSNLTLYKLLTISSKGNAKFIKKDPELWINFAEVNSFYNNQQVDDIDTLSNRKKLKILNKFLKLNKKSQSLLNKRYLTYLKKVLKTKQRERKCYAGKNRIYINHKGESFICSRGLKSRSEMNKVNCQTCWTPCEANFDINQDFFLR